MAADQNRHERGERGRRKQIEREDPPGLGHGQGEAVQERPVDQRRALTRRRRAPPRTRSGGAAAAHPRSPGPGRW